MNYCFMTFEKIKTAAQLRAKYLHNFREKEVENVNPEKTYLNEELISLPKIDGKNNVLSVVYHDDEVGNVHCHAFIVPIDEKGKLNASRFTDGNRICSQMQTSYAEAMMQFGLKRGLKNSHAKHKDIKKYYAELNQTMNIPIPYLEENALDYRNRILQELKTARAVTKRAAHAKMSKQEFQRLYEEEVKSCKFNILWM